jgi:hypothetical protein
MSAFSESAAMGPDDLEDWGFDDSEEREMFEAQALLRADPAYERWLDQLELESEHDRPQLTQL